MKNIFLYLSGFITLLLNFQSTDLQAENPVIIKGRIIDEHKQPIPFATVYITIPQNPTAIVKGGIRYLCFIPETACCDFPDKCKRCNP